MTCLGCSACSISTVTLHDGRNVCTACPDHALECEARHLLTIPLDARRDFLARCEKVRGLSATNELKAVMTALHGAKK